MPEANDQQPQQQLMPMMISSSAGPIRQTAQIQPIPQQQQAQQGSSIDAGSAVLGMLLGAAAGYAVRGVAQNKDEVEATPEGDALIIANLQERLNLLEARNDALNALNVALKDQSSTGSAVVAELQGTIKSLTDRLAAATVGSLSGFPAILGPGDPSVAGFIKGRNGMLISRILPNFLPPAGTQLSQGTYESGQPTTGYFTVSDPTRTVAAKALTIGRSVNNSLCVSLRQGIFPGMAIILNFNEDVADDTDFVCRGCGYANGTQLNVMIVPVGRKSLMLVCTGVRNPYTGYSMDSWNSLVTRDTYFANVSSPTLAQRNSYQSGYPFYRLSHRSARSLTLLSWNIIGNPLAQFTGSCQEALTDLGAIETTLVGPATVVKRLNTGVTPKFYLPDEVGEYNTVELSSAAYM